MSIPYGNVRPIQWDASTVGPGGSTSDLGFGAQNGLFVITFVALFLYGNPGEDCYIAVNDGVICHAAVPNAVTTIPVNIAYGFDAREVEVPIGSEDHLIVTNNASANPCTFSINGYHWQPTPL